MVAIIADIMLIVLILYLYLNVRFLLVKKPKNKWYSKLLEKYFI